MSMKLIERLEAEATRRWSSIPTHVRELLIEAVNRITTLEVGAIGLADEVNDLKAQLRTERGLNAELERGYSLPGDGEEAIH